MRGSSYSNCLDNSYISHRYMAVPTEATNYCGMRLALTLPNEPTLQVKEELELVKKLKIKNVRIKLVYVDAQEPYYISDEPVSGRLWKPEGWEWLEELKEVLTQNVDYACDFIESKWKGVKVSKPQATYMLFIDCEEWCKEHGKTMDDVQRAGLEVGVLWQDGRAFHGEYCIRMNLALPFARVQEAFERLDKYVFQV